MSLDAILSEIERIGSKPFITRQERWSKILAVAEPLKGARYESPSIDRVALGLKKQAYRRADPALDATITILDSARGISAAPLTAYGILRESRARYATRFAEMHEYLSSESGSFDDLALVLDHLRTDTYLNRRASDRTREEKRILEDRIEKRLRNMRAAQVELSVAERIYVRAATTFVAAAAIISAVPASLYSALVG